MLPKFKIAARGQLHIFLYVQKLKNFKSEILQSYPLQDVQYGDV